MLNENIIQLLHFRLKMVICNKIILCLLYHAITLKLNFLTIQLIERILLLITMQVTYIAFLFGKHVVEKLLISYFNEIDIKSNKIYFCTLQVIKRCLDSYKVIGYLFFIFPIVFYTVIFYSNCLTYFSYTDEKIYFLTSRNIFSSWYSQST